MGYLRAFAVPLAAILGWLLGLLAPVISERIKRPYRRRELMAAIIDEMLALRYVMAACAQQIRVRKGQLNDAFLDEIIGITAGYNGPERDEKMISSLQTLRQLSEEQRAAALRDRAPRGGMSLRTYSLPLFTSQVSELAMCSLDFQRRVLRVLYHLDLFNQLAPDASSLFEKTFTSTTTTNRDILIANLDQAYIEAGRRAEIIISIINDLHKQYG